PLIAVAAAVTVSACATDNSTTTPPRTAEQTVRTLTQKIPTARSSVVYTAENDPNHLLGRPGGYLSKASFTDTRITPASLGGTPVGAVDLGGSVETYADAAGAQNRMTYIQGIAKPTRYWANTTILPGRP